MNKKNQHNQK